MRRSMIEPFEPLTQESAPLRNKIMNALRRAIEVGQLEPGTRLVEKDLCQQLGVSRTSLREALRQLQAEGILTEVGGRGLAVVDVTHADAENIYRIRSVLEPLVVEQFIENATAAETKALVQSSVGLKAAYRSGDVEAIVARKREFYDHICAGARNSIAFDLLNKLTILTSVLRRRSLARKQRQSQSVAEIAALVTAIANKEKSAAKVAARTHVVNSANSALRSHDKPAPRKSGEKRRVAVGG